MELIFLVAALVLFIISGVWLWSSGQRPMSLTAIGLACWVASALFTSI